MKRILLALGLTLSFSPLLAQDVSSVRLNEILASGSLLRSTNNRPMDRIELFNTGLAEADLGGSTLGDSSGLPKYMFPAGTIIPSLGFLYVDLDPDADFGIQAGGDTIYFRNIDGSIVDVIDFGPQVIDMSLGRIPDGYGEWTLCETNYGSSNVAKTLGSPAQLRFNEWMATPNNASKNPDWLEIYNPGPLPAQLTGLFLGDSGGSPNGIAPRSFIGAGRQSGFAVFLADDLQGGNHMPFKLSGGGDSLILWSADFAVIDQVQFGAQENGVSQGRVPDGGSTIESFPRRGTEGKPNFGVLTKIVVNEILTHTDIPLEDAIEFYNPTDEPVDMSGWWMSDRESRPSRFVFPAGTVVPAKGFYVLYEGQFRNQSDPADYTFNSAHGDTNYVFEVDETGNAVAYSEVRFPASEKSVSFGRVITSDGDVDYVPMERRTFGKDGTLKGGLPEFRLGTGLPNPPNPKWGPVVINEVMYRPPDLNGSNNAQHEYIELRNLTSKPVKLVDAYRSPWRLGGDGDVFYQFAATDIIPANGYLLLVSFNPADATLLNSFKTTYSLPDNVVIRGPYNGGTNFLDRDVTIELYRPDKPENDANDFGFVPQISVDRVHYEDDEFWPTNSSGTGTSLQRLATSSYGDEPLSWFDDLPTPGRPNAQIVQVMNQPESHGVLESNLTTLHVDVQVATMNTPASTPSFQWLFKNKPIPNSQTNHYTIPVFTRKQAGTYTCVISNHAGSVKSATATLTLVKPVVIKKMLPNIAAGIAWVLAPGKTAIFKPTVTGTKPAGSKSFIYEWYKDDVVIDGQTASILKFVEVTSANNGRYKVIVKNDLSSAESAEIELIVQ